MGASPGADGVPANKREALLAVDREKDLAAGLDDGGIDAALASDDEGTVGEDVGTDRSDEDEFGLRHQDWPADGKSIRRRPGRRAEDDPVGQVGRDETIVDARLDAYDLGQGAFVDDEVVGRREWSQDRPIGPDHLAEEHHPFLHLELAGQDAREDDGGQFGSDVGEKTEAPEVHTPDRHTPRRKGATGAQLGAITPQDNGEIDTFGEGRAIAAGAEAEPFGEVGLEVDLLPHPLQDGEQAARDLRGTVVVGPGAERESHGHGG